MENILYFFERNKKLFTSILIPLLFGLLGYLLGGNTDIYSSINTPSFAPPRFIFPIVWTILYTLMGISFYLIIDKENNNDSVSIYYLQLIINSLWSLLFFRFRLFLFSFIWILLLIVSVTYMIYLFYKLDKKSGLLQIPYLVWITFASILNLSIYLLN